MLAHWFMTMLEVATALTIIIGWIIGIIVCFVKASERRTIGWRWGLTGIMLLIIGLSAFIALVVVTDEEDAKNANEALSALYNN